MVPWAIIQGVIATIEAVVNVIKEEHPDHPSLSVASEALAGVKERMVAHGAAAPEAPESREEID